jgi:oligopeptide/dipeptide ABC transporter ATP-binding protein
VALLEVEDLQVAFDTEDGTLQAVRGLSFTLEAGQTLGIVGESGSGKSVSTQTMVGLTRGARVSGRALFDGADLLTMPADKLRSLRGNDIGMVFQDPLTSLHPQYTVGWQIEEAIAAHESGRFGRRARRGAARKRAIDLLGQVGISQPDRRVDDFPHQFSGGMRQRAMIAMALALNPRLLIADEPTTALDVTVQAQVLELMKRLQQEYGTALILITHDLGVVADMADDVLVMYAGRAVEKADRRTLYYRQHHPYSKGLLASVPQSSAHAAGDRLIPIAGQPPSLLNLPTGCSFHPRCPYVMDVCVDERPELLPVGSEPGHVSACHLPNSALGVGDEAEQIRAGAVRRGRTQPREALAAEGSPHDRPSVEGVA